MAAPKQPARRPQKPQEKRSPKPKGNPTGDNGGALIKPHGNSKYKHELLPIISQMVRAGFTDLEFCRALGIDDNTWYRWQAKHEKLRETLKDWKRYADKRVEQSLYFQALEGNVTAMIFWLKNRQPEEWRDKIDTEEHGRGRYEDLLDRIRELEAKGPIARPPAEEIDGEDLRYNGKGSGTTH